MGKKKNILELTRFTPEEYRGIAKLPLTVVADNVRSMHNVGSLFRTADAFKVEEVVLGGITGTPPHPEIQKTALGADESVAWRHAADTLSAVVELRKEGWKICVLEQVHGSMPLPDFDVPDERLALVVGNEVAGVDQRIVDMADYVLEIPQYGIKHSLNVSVSAGIAIYAFATGLMRFNRGQA